MHPCYGGQPQQGGVAHRGPQTTDQLVQHCGGVTHAVAVLLELTFLPGRATIGTLPLTALGQV